MYDMLDSSPPSAYEVPPFDEEPSWLPKLPLSPLLPDCGDWYSAIRRALALYVGGVFFDCQYPIAAKATTITISRIRYFFSILSNVATVMKFLPNTSKHSRTSSSERAYTAVY